MNASEWTLSTYSSRLFRVAAPLAVVAVMLCLVSCKADQQASQVRMTKEQAASPATVTQASGEGAYSLRIEPRIATRRTILAVSADGFSLQEGPVTWQVNGASASSADADRFDCSGTQRGDRIAAVAAVKGREIRSNEVVVGNTPPELSEVTLQPVMTNQGETFAVSALASDADDDKVTITYAWTVNDALAGNGETLLRALKRNDSVRVEVSGFDGQSWGEKITVSRTVANHPPVFVEHQDFTQSGGSILYQARATDADGDALAYSLASPVAGMTIERLSGRLAWKVPDGYRGEQTATIVADDGHLGTAQYTVTFTVRE